jgi:hypothetical protein
VTKTVLVAQAFSTSTKCDSVKKVEAGTSATPLYEFQALGRVMERNLDILRMRKAKNDCPLVTCSDPKAVGGSRIKRWNKSTFNFCIGEEVAHRLLYGQRYVARGLHRNPKQVQGKATINDDSPKPLSRLFPR